MGVPNPSFFVQTLHGDLFASLCSTENGEYTHLTDPPNSVIHELTPLLDASSTWEWGGHAHTLPV